MEHSNILWVDFLANGDRLASKEKMVELVERAKQSNVSHIVIDAKIPSGFTTFPSEFAYHVSQIKSGRYQAWEGRDFLQEFLEIASGTGMKVLANLDIFAEGDGQTKEGMVYDRPEWQVVHYNQALSNVSTAIENKDDPTVFVNPIHPEVIEYELNIIKEVVSKYQIDGVVLDRCRYPNVYGDFSELSRLQFEQFLGVTVENWPSDIYTLSEGRKVNFGPLFSSWAEWRAKNIKNFVQKAKEVVKDVSPELIFSIYVGSWYPLYYNEGVNWGSKEFKPDLEWAGETYHTSGYAEEFDFIMTGCYYPEVYVEEARKNGRPADWYSVEGGINLSHMAIQGKIPVIASLYLKDYQDNIDQFKKAVSLCKERTNGVMLFDTIYLEEYGWWNDLVEMLKD